MLSHSLIYLSELTGNKSVIAWHNFLFKLFYLCTYVVLKKTEVNKRIKICFNLKTTFRNTQIMPVLSLFCLTAWQVLVGAFGLGFPSSLINKQVKVRRRRQFQCFCSLIKLIVDNRGKRGVWFLENN